MVKNKEMKKFVRNFLILFLPLFFLFSFFDFFMLKEFVASTSASALNSLGVATSLQGLTLVSNGVEFKIINMCTGLVSFSIFASLMYATDRIRNDKRIAYSLVSLPILLSWNIFRVVATLYLASPARLFFMHDFFWIASAAFIVGMYYIVVKHELKEKKKKARPKKKKRKR